MSLWADAGDPGAKFGAARKGAAHLAAVERLKDWARVRFALGDDETVLVSEIARSLPGFPPLETVVAFWTVDGTRHHFNLFKPVEAVVEDDLPPAWLKESLALSEGVECACC
jgi:nitrate reductase delta subunit